MKKLNFLLCLLAISYSISSQEIVLTFNPVGEANTIDSIKITNVESGNSFTVVSEQSVNLTEIFTSAPDIIKTNKETLVYPNPFNGFATLEYSTDKNEKIQVALINSLGQVVALSSKDVNPGIHKFKIIGKSAGIYYVSVLSNTGRISNKLICLGDDGGANSIDYVGYVDEINKVKEKSAFIEAGDLIHAELSSGCMTTIIADQPTESTSYDVEFMQCEDQDGKCYKVVQIGDQWWMAENLAYLPSVSPSSVYSSSDSYYYVNGYEGADVASAKQLANYNTYGVLYNWPAAMAGSASSSSYPSGIQGACPSGWHLPSDDEWEQLALYVSVQKGPYSSSTLGTWRDLGTHLKTTNGWNDNGNGTDDFGFSGLPGGDYYSGGISEGIGYIGLWWSSTEDDNNTAWGRQLLGISNAFGRSPSASKGHGFSVRCIRDESTTIKSGTFIDQRDEYEYKWVEIGEQIWMAENLAYLPSVSPPSDESITEPYYYVYDYSGTDVSSAKATDNFATYGVLYNWPATLTACPDGWHLPTDDEWKQLEMSIGMSQSEVDNTDLRGKNEGTILKAKSGWYSNGNGTDDFGFSGLPGGFRDYYGNFNGIEHRGYWWSSTESDTIKAWDRYLFYSYERIARPTDNKVAGFSVRCIKTKLNLKNSSRFSSRFLIKPYKFLTIKEILES